MKTIFALFLRPFLQIKSLSKPTASHISGSVGGLAQETTEHMTLKRLQSTIPSTQTFQSVANTTTLLSDPIVTHSQCLLPPIRKASASTLSSGSDLGWRDSSITFNSTVRKELEIELVHVLSHAKRICCVRFSRTGEYLAAGCQDGRAYIYDVATATVTWYVFLGCHIWNFSRFAMQCPQKFTCRTSHY
jgi:WD40 repeat protein